MTDRREPAPERGVVWYPADFSRGGLVAGLPDDLEPRLLEPGLREKVVADIRAVGYRFVAVDLEGFKSGNLNRGIDRNAMPR